MYKLYFIQTNRKIPIDLDTFFRGRTTLKVFHTPNPICSYEIITADRARYMGHTVHKRAAGKLLAYLPPFFKVTKGKQNSFIRC